MICNNCERLIKNKGAFSKHIKTCNLVFSLRDEILNLYLNENCSINDIKKKFNIGSCTINDVLGDKIRTTTESRKMARKRYPEKYKHTEETKKRLREIRLRFMKENPDKTAWRKNNLSYPEKLFLNKLESISWDKQYSIIREYSFFPYFIDFAFINEKVAVEIDGSQHLLEERSSKDTIKDELLINNGWKVVRISENEIKNNIENVFLKLQNILSLSDNIKRYKIGVILNPKKRQKKERNKNGLTEMEYNRSLNQRKVDRPKYSQLLEDIKSLGFTKTGKKYGVSDNTIRKWVKFYEKNMSH